MSRTITLLFRRDPSRDKHSDSGQFEGYQPLWPDGSRVGVAMDAFCKHGQRLLGLGKHLVGCQEKLVRLICMPLAGRDSDLNRIPGHRVRRFYLHRQGQAGRLHFMDGTPTTAVFDLEQDEPRVLNWIGLAGVPDGEVQWLDLAAITVDSATAPNRPRVSALHS
jgi:hypothetical protein